MLAVFRQKISIHSGVQMMKRTRNTVLAVVTLLLSPLAAQAAYLEFTDLTDYSDSVGDTTVIDFVGFEGQTITDQFLTSGLEFDSATVNAGSLLFVGGGGIGIDFASTQNHFGVGYPGAVKFDFFLDGVLVETSSRFGGSGAGFFAGVTGLTFDRVVISDWVDNFVFIDRVYFASVDVPEPGTLALLGLGLVGMGYARRRKVA